MRHFPEKIRSLGNGQKDEPAPDTLQAALKMACGWPLPPMNASRYWRDQPEGRDNVPNHGANMKIAVFAVLGTIAGAVVGAALGVLTGIAWVNIFQTSDFEGYSAMLVFFTFAPAGGLIGAIAGALWSGLAASRARIRIDPGA